MKLSLFLQLSLILLAFRAHAESISDAQTTLKNAQNNAVRADENLEKALQKLEEEDDEDSLEDYFEAEERWWQAMDQLVSAEGALSRATLGGTGAAEMNAASFIGKAGGLGLNSLNGATFASALGAKAPTFTDKGSGATFKVNPFFGDANYQSIAGRVNKGLSVPSGSPKSALTNLAYRNSKGIYETYGSVGKRPATEVTSSGTIHRFRNLATNSNSKWESNGGPSGQAAVYENVHPSPIAHSINPKNISPNVSGPIPEGAIAQTPKNAPVVAPPPATVELGAPIPGGPIEFDPPIKLDPPQKIEQTEIPIENLLLPDPGVPSYLDWFNFFSKRGASPSKNHLPPGLTEQIVDLNVY